MWSTELDAAYMPPAREHLEHQSYGSKSKQALGYVESTKYQGQGKGWSRRTSRVVHAHELKPGQIKGVEKKRERDKRNKYCEHGPS